jgi:hypothetical protein
VGQGSDLTGDSWALEESYRRNAVVRRIDRVNRGE